MSYFPLEFLERSGMTQFSYESLLQVLKESFGISFSGTPKEEFLKAVLDPRFCNNKYVSIFGHRSGVADRVHRMCMNNMDVLKSTLGIDAKNYDKYTLSAEWKDIIAVPLLLEKWQKFKQVYKVNDCFADSLLDSDDPELSYSDLEALPYDSFYVDLADVKRFYPISGCFVNVNKVLGGCISVSFCWVTYNFVYNSSYSVAINSSGDGTVKFSIDTEKGPLYFNVTTPIFADSSLIESDNVARDELSNCTVDGAQFFNLLYQILKYLVSYKPDVQESAVTRRTYRKSDKVKNKFSEVIINEVGYVWASDFGRRQSVSSGTVSVGTGKCKRPHAIRGHWHRHWVGTGDTKKLVTMWHEPTFTGGGSGYAEVHKLV